ncbi:uncharacterized protein [Periplaneta americana]|uniref:uncharacterized protein n=1 Tax=Periplaneta americana TaxID=6978 RepID=UPI0037E711BB
MRQISLVLEYLMLCYIFHNVLAKSNSPRNSEVHVFDDFIMDSSESHLRMSPPPLPTVPTGHYPFLKYGGIAAYFGNFYDQNQIVRHKRIPANQDTSSLITTKSSLDYDKHKRRNMNTKSRVDRDFNKKIVTALKNSR